MSMEDRNVELKNGEEGKWGQGVGGGGGGEGKHGVFQENTA